MNQPRQYRPRILFFGEAVTLAHVARPFTLAQSLDSDRYEVYFASDPRYASLFPDTRITSVAVDSIPSATFLKALAQGRRLYSRQNLEQYVEEDLEIIGKVKPDLIVGDFRLSLAVSAPLAGVSLCAITNSYWSPYSQSMFPIPEHPTTALLGVTFAQRLFSGLRPFIFGWHARPLNQLRRQHQLRPLGHNLRRLYTWADYVLYADVPELSSVSNPPANHLFLGPMLWSPSVLLPRWWKELPDGDPIVYVSLGSSGKEALLPQIIRGLAHAPVTLAVATLGTVPEIPVPENTFVADYLPGDKLAARADLVICNGGSPATQQALAVGTPVLGIASNMDQHLNMSEVQRFGAGCLLRSEHCNADSVRNLVNRMLSDSRYGEAARKTAALYQRYSATKRFQAFIEGLVRNSA
ncbi:MAG TPA: glycosyl transferase family 1 [Gammaproteobacteria bacterium]|nr:glycosyl transferase family 1 [Gammaproteobacteria bacterium]